MKDGESTDLLKNHPVSTDSLKFIGLQISQQHVKINVKYAKIDKLLVFLFWISGCLYFSLHVENVFVERMLTY